MTLPAVVDWLLAAAATPTPTPTPAPGPAAVSPAPTDLLWKIVDYGIRAAGALGIPAAVTWFLVDRRRTKAAATVDERSITANVAKNDASAFEAYVLAVEKAISAERASKDRQLLNLEHLLADAETRHAVRVQELVADSVAKDMLAADLRAQVATLTRELRETRARARANDEEGVA
jgi:FAD/FMN-containing dehydrogenase